MKNKLSVGDYVRFQWFSDLSRPSFFRISKIEHDDETGETLLYGPRITRAMDPGDYLEQLDIIFHDSGKNCIRVKDETIDKRITVFSLEEFKTEVENYYLNFARQVLDYIVKKGSGK